MTGIDITYTLSTDTVHIEIKLIPDQGGAAISKVSGSDNLQTNDALGGDGSAFWWIVGGGLVVILIRIRHI